MPLLTNCKNISQENRHVPVPGDLLSLNCAMQLEHFLKNDVSLSLFQNKSPVVCNIITVPMNTVKRPSGERLSKPFLNCKHFKPSDSDLEVVIS